jgi:hypothetical protein
VVPVTESITNMFHYEAFIAPRFKMFYMARSSTVMEITHSWSRYGMKFFRVTTSHTELRTYHLQMLYDWTFVEVKFTLIGLFSTVFL